MPGCWPRQSQRVPELLCPTRLGNKPLCNRTRLEMLPRCLRSQLVVPRGGRLPIVVGTGLPSPLPRGAEPRQDDAHLGSGQLFSSQPLAARARGTLAVITHNSPRDVPKRRCSQAQ